MDLLAADIDDAFAAADEVVAVAALLDQVAGVDEAIGYREIVVAEIAGGGARGTDAQGALLDAQFGLGAGLADIGGGETGEAVADVEADPGLGGGEGVARLAAG